MRVFSFSHENASCRATKSPGNRRRAGTAIGLQHVAVDLHGSRPERRQVNDRAQRASYQALDLLRAARLLAARRLALGAGIGRARQHAVFGGHPAAAAVLEEGRHAVLHARGAQHARIAELDEHRAFGMPGVAALRCAPAAARRRAAACACLAAFPLLGRIPCHGHDGDVVAIERRRPLPQPLPAPGSPARAGVKAALARAAAG